MSYQAIKIHGKNLKCILLNWKGQSEKAQFFAISTGRGRNNEEKQRDHGFQGVGGYTEEVE